MIVQKLWYVKCCREKNSVWTNYFFYPSKYCTRKSIVYVCSRLRHNIYLISKGIALVWQQIPYLYRSASVSCLTVSCVQFVKEPFFYHNFFFCSRYSEVRSVFFLVRLSLDHRLFTRYYRNENLWTSHGLGFRHSAIKYPHFVIKMYC